MRHRRGVTLLEVLVAGVVLSVGLLGALELVARTTAVTNGAGDRARALMFARSKMEEILKEPVLQAGTDRSEGVDETTDYDWEAAITETESAPLYLVVVLARNRVTGTEVTLSALRRPDIETLPETGTTESGAGGTGAAAGAGGGI